MKIGQSNSDNSTVAKNIIKDIVCMNPGKNNFVKRNLDQFKEFMTDEVKEAYVQKAVEFKELANNSLIPENSAEKALVIMIGEQVLTKKNWKLSGSDIKFLNWGHMRNITNKAISSVESNSITMDRAKEQIAERIGIIFALVSADNPIINDSIKKTFDSFLDPTVSSYIWKKNDIDSQFLDMNDRIQKVMDKYKSFTADEIKETYTNLTKPPQKKKGRPSNIKLPKNSGSISDEEQEDVGDQEIDYVSSAYDAYGNWNEPMPKKKLKL
jgi:predicted PilT family ATPase